MSCGSFSKLPNVKSVFNTFNTEHFWATLFFRASASCSKILNGEKYIHYSENFQGNSFFSGQAQVAQKS